jgi:hypothetical protein
MYLLTRKDREHNHLMRKIKYKPVKLIDGSYQESSIKEMLEKCSKVIEIAISCPKCKKRDFISIPESLKGEFKGLLRIFIPKDIICSHKFVINLDMNFSVRGYERIDIQLDEKDDI